MLKVLYQKLRLSSKGNLNHNHSNSRKLQIRRVGKTIVQGIPVLSIFALVGIVSCATNPELTKVKLFSVPSASAISVCPNKITCPDGATWIDGMSNCYCKPNTTEATKPSNPGETSSSITIDDNIIYDNIDAVYDMTNYASHKITIAANNVESYALTITGPATISTKDANGGAVTGATTLSAADNKTPDKMANNSWGYAWSTEGSIDSNLAYQSFTGTAQTLESDDNVSSGQVNFNKKLTFAAKFAEDAKDGHYKASVNLSLTTTPQQVAVAWDDMVYLQDMSAKACSSVPVGTTKTLKDMRDLYEYTIAKLSDGNCWMLQNLRLTESMYLDSNNTDLNDIEKYITPMATTGSFNNNNTTQQMRNSSDDDYGAYYSWCAATANTCQVDGTPIAANIDATSSICPKGWKLPKGGSSGDFQALYDKYYSSWATNNSKNGYWLGAANTAGGGAFFPAAGRVSTSGLSSTGSSGLYWSRTASNTTDAYHLSFNSSSVYPANFNGRYLGFSVRCVAYSS